MGGGKQIMLATMLAFAQSMYSPHMPRQFRPDPGPYYRRCPECGEWFETEDYHQNRCDFCRIKDQVTKSLVKHEKFQHHNKKHKRKH